MYKNIRRLCDEAGISIYRLEKEIGFSTGSIDKWKTTIPSVDKVRRVANYFDISIEELLDGEKEKNE